MKRVLVTGATGFIGAPCVHYLAEAGYVVHAAALAAPEGTDGEVTYHDVDLLDTAQLRSLIHDVRPTHLLHLAWYVAPGAYWTSPENLRWVKAGLDLVQAFADEGGVRAVMVGTCAEYEQSAMPLVEGVTPLRPTTLYSAAKAALHLTSQAYFAERAVSMAWAHLFYLYGPNEYPSRLVPSVIRALKSGEQFECAHPSDARDFLYVDDVADALVHLLDSEARGDVNIASGEGIRIDALLAEIAAEIGAPELVSCSEHAVETLPVVADVGRLRREVGWAAKRTRAEAIRSTIEWWSSQDRGV